MKTNIGAFAILAFALSSATHAAAAEKIGTATLIATSVTSDSGQLKTGDVLFQNETIVTDANGVGQFEFLDKTRLAVGPGSTVVLDNFVYDSDSSKTRVVVNLTEGALRFITGESNKEAYEIVTPTATIGVRGTVFDLYTKKNGEIAVAMIEGEVDVCPRVGRCFRHGVIGKFLHMTPLGIISMRDRWDGSFLTGVPFKTALPFLADQKKLVPSLRGKVATVGKYATLDGKLVKAVKKPLTKLPKLKLPKLFK